MITIFTIPKPFEDHIKTIQRNAIQSWMRLSPSPEIFLCGDEPGISETASEFGLRHIPKIDKNEFGTPLLSSAFRKVQQQASNSVIIYTNTDIIFLPDLIQAIQQIPFRTYLLCGQRMDVEITEPIDFTKLTWGQKLLEFAQHNGRWFQIGGIDYFIFPKGFLSSIPDFAVGRPCWDNWMIFNARSRKIPVIDLTPSVMPIHQNHNYNHVKQRNGPKWEGPEAEINLKLAGGKEHLFDLYDATFQLTPEKLKKLTYDPQLSQRVSRQNILASRIGFRNIIRLKIFWIIHERLRFLPEQMWRQLIYSLAD